jgi:hypothetical protein
VKQNVLDSEAKFLVALAREKGIASAAVSDGTVIVFRRDKLQELLDANTSQDVVVVFVQTKPTSKHDIS